MASDPTTAADANGGSGHRLLASRLRSRRLELEISQRELARRLDVSPSLISQVESGKASPSVGTLYAMIDALGLSLADVSAGEPAPGAGASTPGDAAVRPPSPTGVVAPQDRRAIVLASGVRWERLTLDDDPDVEFLELIYEVGASSSPDGLMQHTGHEYGVVLEGTFGLALGFDEYVLTTGYSVSFDSTVPHRLWNAGETVARALWFSRGRRPTGYSRSVGEARTPGPRPA